MLAKGFKIDYRFVGIAVVDLVSSLIENNDLVKQFVKIGTWLVNINNYKSSLICLFFQ